MIGQTPVDDATDGAIREILRQELQPFGLSEVRISPGEDHDGDPVLRIDTYYASSGDRIDARTLAGVGTKLRDRLWKLGETRFPHVRHHVPDERLIAG